MEEITLTLRSKLATLPQPIACAIGRVCRYSREQELVEFCLKAGEVTARYSAALAISSFCARGDKTSTIPNGLKDFRGDLSFGHFLAVLKEIARSTADHPLKDYLKAGFGADRPSEVALDKLLNIRNKHGHGLEGLTVAKAKNIVAQDQPLQNLVQAIKGCQGLLDHPIFLLEDQQFQKQVFIGRRLLLMGDAEPIPDMVELSSGLDGIRTLYLGVRGGVLRLPPFLIWDIVEARASFGIYLLHRIRPGRLEYITVFNDEFEQQGADQAFDALTRGELQPMEKVSLRDGNDFYWEWIQRRKTLEQAAELSQGVIPWSSFDQKTLNWYGSHLKSDDSARRDEPRRKIVQKLLDSRDVVTPDEIRQLVILFGKEAAVSKLLKRPLIDCRARSSTSTKRWEERVESSFNLIESLRKAIEFFGRHIGVKGATIDGLKATAGSADYIAMREALVNLFIHQDYNNPGVAAQIEIRKDRSTFHNAGKALVSDEALVDGGKSTSRNPLIGRALRLIGFAELAGSGLYAVHQAWRHAQRRPPVIESNAAANTFTLTLDWRPLQKTVDGFWKQKLGVTITPEQASILSLLSNPESFTLDQIASATGLYLSDAKEAVDYLKLQMLVTQDDNGFRLRSDLAELAANREQKAR
jgi:predicted HTH transcriptional regulator